MVIGGSAGSLSVLKTIVGSLPDSFPAAILVAIHTSPDSPSLLGKQLSRLGRLPASYPADEEQIRPGHIYLAPPDYHLSVEDSKVRILRGPRENRHRPAIDPLFRTAARIYGERLIGIVLSGMLDDGSAGLYAVKQRGGVAIVQDPNEATAAEMPLRALEYAGPQYVLRARDIGPKLISLVNHSPDQFAMSNRNKKKAAKRGTPKDDKPDRNLKASHLDEGEGKPSVFACPECHGVLWELEEKDTVRFRCRVGHSYGQDSLVTEFSQSSEAALWAAMRALEEKAAMQRRVAETLKGDVATGTRLREQSKADDANARLIREMIFRPGALSADTQLESESKKIA